MVIYGLYPNPKKKEENSGKWKRRGKKKWRKERVGLRLLGVGLTLRKSERC